MATEPEHEEAQEKEVDTGFKSIANELKGHEAEIKKFAEYASKTLQSINKGMEQVRSKTPEERRASGKALRAKVPRTSQAEWKAPAKRDDPVELIKSQGKTRIQDLLSLRYERMGVSPFTFYRGAALVMASDLSHTPTTNLNVQACGDAHIANFGFFGSAEGRMVFDINDFDETSYAPWEWDIKRLVTSIEICGRDRGFTEEQRTKAVRACATTYSEVMQQFASMGNLDVWYAHFDVEEWLNRYQSELKKTNSKLLEKTVTKAATKTSAKAVSRLTEVVDGQLRIISNPPLVTPLRELIQSKIPFTLTKDITASELVTHIMREYRMSLRSDTRSIIDQYSVVDIARKVVGVGSVGTRAWIIVMRGRDDNDSLVLQVKEADESVLERYNVKSIYMEHGRRVIAGQRAMQSAGDPLLGWTRSKGPDGKTYDYYVRQLWDKKGSVDLNIINPDQLVMISRMSAWTLAHAHARTGERIAISGYLGKGSTFDKAMVTFAQAYADQNEADYDAFTKARKAGKLD